MRTISSLALLAVSFTTLAEQNGYTNLKVLPKDISRDALGEIMLDNLRGLGLPRLAGEGCLYCHVGDLERPRGEWDYASDAKPMKAKARTMMAMVRTINESYVAALDDRIDAELVVDCASCHAGRTDPRPLTDVLWSTWERDGIAATKRRYEELREAYFAADAYDFRPHVLPAIAIAMADEGAIDDAIALARLNVEVHGDDLSARQAAARLELERTIDASGVAAALASLERYPEEILTPDLLDGLAWRLRRSERRAAGDALIEANLERFPQAYRAIESQAFVLASSDREEQAFLLLERWLAEHPDHARARRLLTNLRSRAN